MHTGNCRKFWFSLYATPLLCAVPPGWPSRSLSVWLASGRRRCPLSGGLLSNQHRTYTSHPPTLPPSGCPSASQAHKPSRKHTHHPPPPSATRNPPTRQHHQPPTPIRSIRQHHEEQPSTSLCHLAAPLRLHHRPNQPPLHLPASPPATRPAAQPSPPLPRRGFAATSSSGRLYGRTLREAGVPPRSCARTMREHVSRPGGLQKNVQWKMCKNLCNKCANLCKTCARENHVWKTMLLFKTGK